MKSCDKMVQSVFRRGNERLQKRKRRIAIMKRTSATICSICALIVFFKIVSQDSEKPEVAESSKAEIVLSNDVLYTSQQTTDIVTTTMITTTVASTAYEISINDTILTTPKVKDGVYTVDVSVYETIPFSSLNETSSIITKNTTTITTTTMTTAESMIKTESSSNVSTDFAYSGSCGENAYFEFDEATHTLHFIGEASYIDVSTVEHLIGHFDKVIIDRGITTFGNVNSNYLFGVSTEYVDNITIYHYKQFCDVKMLKRTLGKCLTFIDLDRT